MKLQCLIIKNAKEIEKAEKLGLDIPSEKFKPTLLIVDINDIGFLFCNEKGNIEIEIRGCIFEIAYSKNIIDAISENIEKRNK